MNLFNGMDHDQIVSTLLMAGIFTAYAVLVIASLVGFYLMSKPVAGKVRRSAGWFLVALAFFCVSVTSTVWGAPADRSFFGDSGLTFKIFIGVGFCVVGVVFLGIGALHSLAQTRRLRASA